MYIIEMCGLPGCGKTTMTDKIRTSLSEFGIKVENLQAKPLQLNKVDSRKLKLAVCFDKDCRRLWRVVRNVYKKRLNEQQKYWVWRIVLTYYVVRQAEKYGLEIALFDEGCVQFITSIVHEDFLGKEELIFLQEVYQRIYMGRDVLIVKCEISCEEAMNRIKRRNRPRDRFLLGTDEDILRRLETKGDNLEKAVSIFPKEDILYINMEDPNCLSDLEAIIKQNYITHKRGKAWIFF